MLGNIYRRKEELRRRENSGFDDSDWYRFGRNQNLDKQKIPKLIVAGTVPRLRITIDPNGEYYLNNVRVNGVIPRDSEDLWFLFAVLNGAVADFVFRRIAKPKNNGYFEANRQYIAPLPIPRGTPEQKRQIAQAGRRLQALHTQLQGSTDDFARRIKSCPRGMRNEDWLFPFAGTVQHWKSLAPQDFDSQQKTAWAKEKRTSRLKAAYDELQRHLQGELVFDARLRGGELAFAINGVEAIGGVFVENDEARWLFAQWKQIARELTGTDEITAEKLSRKLRGLPSPSTPIIKNQVIALEDEINQLRDEIRRSEERLENLLFDLYQLTPEECILIKTDGRTDGSA